MDPAALALGLLAAAMVLAGLAGTLVPAIPGVPLVFAGLWLAAWTDGYAHVGGKTLVVLGVLAILALAIDFLASALGAKKVGASRQAVAGATIGAVVGVFFGLPGLLLGPFAGAVLGELSAQRSVDQAARVGLAAWAGLIVGILTKLVLSLVMLGVFAWAWFL